MRRTIVVGRMSSALCVGLGFLAVACSGCRPPSAAPPPAAPPPVTVAKPVVESIIDYEETTGRTEASESVVVRARVSGYLQKVTFQTTLDREPTPGTPPPTLKEGDMVEAGTVLFVIDARPYQAVLDAAQADFDRATALLNRYSADLARAENLKANNNISREEYDRIAASRAEALAQQAAAKAQIAAAQLNVEFTQVKAPISGRVGRALVTAGNLVTADLTELTTIVREDPIQVYFDLPEQVILRYQKIIRENKFTSAREQDLPVEVELSNETGFPHSGVIDFVDNRLDRATATLKIRGRFDNPLQGQGLRIFTPGLFVRVRIPASRPHEALLVSERAIISDQGDKIVFVVEPDGTVRRRVVQIGALHGRLRVVTSGLKADERIVVNGLQRARDGGKVTPQEAPMPGLPTPSGTPPDAASPTGAAPTNAAPANTAPASR